MPNGWWTGETRRRVPVPLPVLSLGRTLLLWSCGTTDWVFQAKDQPYAQGVQCAGAWSVRVHESGLQGWLQVLCVSAVKSVQEKSCEDAGVRAGVHAALWGGVYGHQGAAH